MESYSLICRVMLDCFEGFALEYFIYLCIRAILQLNESFCLEFFVPYGLPLVFVQTKSIIYFHLWSVLRGSVYIQLDSNLFWFIEGQTPFSTFWHAIMSSTMNQYRMLFVQTSTLLPSMHCNLTKYGRCCMQKLPTKSQVELEDNHILDRSCTLSTCSKC